MNIEFNGQAGPDWWTFESPDGDVIRLCSSRFEEIHPSTKECDLLVARVSSEPFENARRWEYDPVSTMWESGEDAVLLTLEKFDDVLREIGDVVWVEFAG